MDEMIPPVPAAEVVPHAGRMSLLRSVLAHGAKEILVDAEIGPDAVFFRPGGVPSWVALEYMAQAAAAHAGMLARAIGKPPRAGMLVGTRRLDLRTPAFPAGAVLHVFAVCEFDNGDTAVYDCRVFDPATDAPLAEGRVTIQKT